MVEDVTGWSLRSVLVSVSDLDRSSKFYNELLPGSAVHREDQIAVITAPSAHSTLYLREVPRFGSRSGEDGLGLRALVVNVGTFAELDRVEEALKAHDAFRDRPVFDADAHIESVRGYDPDRLPIVFVTENSNHELSPADMLRVAEVMYAIDV